MVNEPATDPFVGTLVDHRYAVRSRVAGGGMSTVYLATDQRLDRDVALKILHPQLAADESFLGRLAREAKAAARLSHPHVVGVLDQGIDGRTAYLVMEYIPGHTLRDVINDKGALPPRLALALIDPVVEGLAAAHAAGFVHRDVKPENVLIADDGRIKVGDFGLARAVTATTSTGTLIGTVAYVSPELVLGKPADARSDVYSVGIVLFEMLTGRQPFEGEVPIQVAYQHVNGTVGPPSDLVPGLAAEVDELVQWCTANDPEHRPVDGTALLQELRHIRTNLTDAELDLHPPAVGSRNNASGGSSAAGSAPTEIIGRISNPTAALPFGRRPVTPPDAVKPAPPGNRARKKAAREEERARARAAATPARSLRDGNPRRRGALWAVLLVIIALLATGAGWFFGMGPGSAAAVPPVANKTVAQAQQLLEQAGFRSTTSDVFDDNVPAGLVVGSDPAAGLEVRKLQPVSLFVSKGPQLFPLPKLAGETLADAQAAVKRAGMVMGAVTERFDENVAAGVVLSQNPAAGTDVRRGTPVALLVSKGPRPLPVPSVVGQTRNKAMKAIEDAGLSAVVAAEEVFDREVPKGAVASQSPANGTLARGGTVTLTISKGPRMVEVPSYIGKQASDARKALEALGFEVRVNNILGGFFGTVRDQDPVGTEVPEGSVITLTVV